jgi:PaaX-like protein C-terminal domain.
MPALKWFVISYNLPTEPSRHRVATWRALKRLGAVNIQQSMWVLPESEENGDALRELAAEVEAASGEALLMESLFFRSEDEARIVERFNEMRDAEYGEFIEECGKYLKEIEKEIAKKKFIYAELEEEEAEHEKLASWHGRIAARDLFSAGTGEAAKKMLERIDESFEGYARMVYDEESKQ